MEPAHHPHRRQPPPPDRRQAGDLATCPGRCPTTAQRLVVQRSRGATRLRGGAATAGRTPCRSHHWRRYPIPTTARADQHAMQGRQREGGNRSHLPGWRVRRDGAFHCRRTRDARIGTAMAATGAQPLERGHHPGPIAPHRRGRPGLLAWPTRRRGALADLAKGDETIIRRSASAANGGRHAADMLHRQLEHVQPPGNYRRDAIQDGYRCDFLINPSTEAVALLVDYSPANRNLHATYASNWNTVPASPPPECATQ